MEKVRFIKAVAIAVIAIALYSCKGDTGPAGPAGVNGNTANVSVYTFTVTPGSWSTNSSYPWEIDCSLTTGVINTSGAMECYYSADSVNFLQLPWISNGNTPYYEQSWVYNTIGGVSVRWYNIAANPTTAPTAPPKAYFKVVSIPPSVIKQNPNVNWNDWHDISSVLVAERMQAH